MNKSGQWGNSRKVIERIFIRGELVLKTPASFGNGDAEGTTDIPLLLDALDGRSPLLTGASIAGALRNYLREYEHGYGWEEQRQASAKSKAERLFGCLDDAYVGENGHKQKSSVESWLMVDDALGKFPPGRAVTELRDGVAIDPRTRTVEEDERGGHKFDMELLPAGTRFPLSFEFWKTADNEDLLPALVTSLQGLQDGKIGLGLRKRRGLGECTVRGWQVWRYRMDEPDGLLGWLKHDPERPGAKGADILSLLGVALDEADRRKTFTLDAQFALYSSLLIRSEGTENEPSDIVHLKSWREDGKSEKPILSGTSLAGALRARALRIANTILGREKGRLLIDEMFGRRIRTHADLPSGSQVVVKETVVDNVSANLVQSRVKIDRFTGGSYPQALFTQQPLWVKPGGKQVHIHLELRHPQASTEADFHAKIGLLLLALKDLWTGDLPLGGESSVGRGRLQGLEAVLQYAGEYQWTLQQGEQSLSLDGSDQTTLESFVQAFLNWEAPQVAEGMEVK